MGVLRYSKPGRRLRTLGVVITMSSRPWRRDEPKNRAVSRCGHTGAIPLLIECRMSKITKVKRCVRLAENARGRDLVVGDLHGHRELLEQALDQIGFDPARDRVFSVGDLVDRGPDSLATLALIEEPWFHAVLGNHELMLLNYLGYYCSRIHARKAYAAGAGNWVLDAMSRWGKRLSRLADRVASLPLAIHVEGRTPFNVLHGDLQPLGASQDSLERASMICVHRADEVVTSRHNFGEALKTRLEALEFGTHRVQLSQTPRGLLPITYVGHSPVRHVTVHRSYVYVDQGLRARGAKPSEVLAPTLLDHRRFAYWLGGVASARGLPQPDAGADRSTACQLAQA